MICYRDTTFCSQQSHCATQECRRRLTDDDQNRIKKQDWPVAYSDYSNLCGKFVPLEKKV